MADPERKSARVPASEAEVGFAAVHTTVTASATLGRVAVALATGISALTGAAVIMGWLYASAYFGTFRAKWLVTELPITVMVGLTAEPLLVLFFGVVLGVSLRASQAARDAGAKKAADAIQGAFLTVAMLCLVTYAYCTFPVLGPTRLPVHLGGIGLMDVGMYVCWFVLVGGMLGLLYLLRTSGPRKPGLLGVVGTVWVLDIVFFLPLLMGYGAANRDKDPSWSRLPRVYTTGHKEYEHLLLVVDGRYYLARLTGATGVPGLRVVGKDSIELIRAPEGINKRLYSSCRESGLGWNEINSLVGKVRELQLGYEGVLSAYREGTTADEHAEPSKTCVNLILEAAAK